MDVEELPNVGPVAAEWLRTAGVGTVERLREIGPVAAFLAVRESGESPSLNLLWALVTGLRGEHWTSLSDIEKQSLKVEVEDAG